MAGKKFKGITIEIAGDTTPLQKSLEGINKKTKDVQSELRQVERLLKLDPSNTELLAQKQKLLAEAVDGTKEKLNLVKEAEKQVKEQFEQGKVGEEQYRAIQREVINAEQELSKLEVTIGNINNKWDAASKSIGKFGEGSEKLGRKIAPLSAAVTAGGVAATKLSMDFDEAIAKVSTIADEKVMSIETMKEAIIDLSNETGISAMEIADNVYDAISAGQDTADAVNFVGESLRLSKAGFADAGDSLDLLTTILNAYNLESEEAAKVNDILIQTQNKGKVTVGELSSTMGKIIPSAKTANVNLEQLGAGYAIMTSSGIAAAETTTYMNSMLNELNKTGSKSDKTLKELTGKSFSELSSEGETIADILEILSVNAEESGLKLSDMFGSAEASKAALTLLGDDADVFNNTLKEMKSSSGNTQKALEDLNTPAQELRESMNKLKNTAIKLGNALAPVANIVANILEKISDAAINMDDKTLNLIATIGVIVAGIAPLLIVIGKIATGVSAIMGLMSSLSGLFAGAGAAAGTAAGGTGAFSGVIAAITGPIGIAIAAVVGLIAAVTYLWNTNEEFREKIKQIWEEVKEVFSITIELIKEIINTFVERAKEMWALYGEDITKITDGLWKGVLGIIEGAINIIKGILQVFVGLFTGDFERMKEGAVSIFRGLWQTIKSIISGAWSIISGAFGILKTNITEWFTTLATDAVQWGVNMISGFIDGIKSMASAAASAVSGVVGSVKSYIGFNSPAEKGEGRNIVKWGANMISGFADGITSAIPDLEKTMASVMAEPVLNVSGGAGSLSYVNHIHSGTIKVIGVNNKGETVGAFEQVVKEMRRESRL